MMSYNEAKANAERNFKGGESIYNERDMVVL